MPNRIIREGILTSEKINKCSDGAQNLFIRLMLVVDDYGRYHGIPSLIKSHCYPFDSKPLTTVSKMLTELIDNNLIRYYEHENKKYLEINNFGQRLRQMKSKYPDPPTIDSNPLTSDSIVRPETKRMRNESENEYESNIEVVKKIKYLDTVYLSNSEYETLKEKHGEKNVDILIEILDNYKDSNGKKYKSDYKAILSWVINEAKKSKRYIEQPLTAEELCTRF